MEEIQDGYRRWKETQMYKEYIDYSRYFIPEREEQILTICNQIQPPDGAMRIVELCCGEGLLAGALLERFPSCSVLAMDGAPKMIETAKQNLARYGGRVEYQQFNLAEMEWRSMAAPPDAVVSSLAIHHLDDAGKRSLFDDMFIALKPGGAFVIADVLKLATGLAKSHAAEAWKRVVRRTCAEIDGNLDKYQYFLESGWNLHELPAPKPVDKPSRLLDQLNWLTEAGFVNVDVFWMKAGFAVFGGYKAE